jgi:electron transfer flavoprotein alpha subunit
MIRIVVEECTGCGLCIKACPSDALRLEDEIAVFIEENCTYCAVCVPSCKQKALKMERKAVTEDVSAFRDVWVLAEQYKGELKSVSLELLGKGRELAEALGQQLCCVLLGGPGTRELCSTLAAHGADRIHLVESEALTDYSTDAYTDALSILITQHKPNVLLYGATHLGRDLAPAVASNLGLGLTADCTGLSIEEKDNLLLQTRPAFGGNVMADIVCPNTRPQMATVRPNVFSRPEPQEGRTCEVVEAEIDLSPKKIRTKVLEVMETPRTGTCGVEEADVVVAGGRGIGEDFGPLSELAELLCGAVGCSRPIVEKGWMPKAAQVGQSGKTVSPRLYIAAGISGCIQHEVGIRSSDVIVAINSDANAAIFDVADFGIVGDANQILPLLTKELRKRQGQ